MLQQKSTGIDPDIINFKKEDLNQYEPGQNKINKTLQLQKIEQKVIMGVEVNLAQSAIVDIKEKEALRDRERELEEERLRGKEKEE